MNTNSQSATHVDPVCGMTVDPQKAAGASKHEGRSYYFCSRGCETKFDADPEKYLKGGAEPSGSCCGGHCH
jgi:Cu+-exporting ATPase